MATADPPRCARPDGFTLIEVMVAMVITGILSVVIFQFIIGQDRFAQTQSAREEVQQNARVAAEIISSELRSAAPGGMDQIEEELVGFESSRLFGIVCNTPSSNEVVITAATSADADALNERFGLKLQDASGEWNYASENKNHRIVIRSADLSDCADTPYSDDGGGPPPDHGDVSVFRLTRESGGPFPSGDYVIGESLVVLYDVLSYFLRFDEATDAWWIYRQRRGDSPQPLAGPIAPDGLRFEYLDLDEQVTADPAQVRQVRISVLAQSQRRPSEVERKDATVFLRQ